MSSRFITCIEHQKKCRFSIKIFFNVAVYLISTELFFEQKKEIFFLLCRCKFGALGFM